MKISALIALAAAAVPALAAWDIANPQLTVQTGTKSNTLSFSDASQVQVWANSIIKVGFESVLNDKGTRAHQTVVKLRDPSTPGLEFAFPASVRPNGHAEVSIAYSAIPRALTDRQLEVVVLVGSFGGDAPAEAKAAAVLAIEPHPSGFQKPVRLELKPEINHIFHAPPRTVSAFVAVVFQAAVVALLLGIVGYFVAVGNFESLGSALAASPLGHGGLLVSLVGYEIAFVKYFLGSSIFDTLFAVAIISPLAIFAGSRALREVRARRVKGAF